MNNNFSFSHRLAWLLSLFCMLSAPLALAQDDVIRTSEELVRRAAQGGTLRLAAVTFRL